MERARRRAMQLESAMQLLDDEDPALVPLQEALKKAKAQPCASEMCVARKKKRLEEAEQEILEAIKRRDVLKAEVVAGEEDLPGSKPNSPERPHRCWCFRRDCHLKARLAVAEEERDAALRSNSSKRQAAMPRTSGVRTRTDHIPPMPSSVPAELSQWLLDRQSDLQETLELGGPADLVLQLTSMLSDGAVRLMEMNGGVVP